ncbi:MAG: hypothetical protein Fur0022_32390 [Anaerolineales bacterium]
MFAQQNQEAFRWNEVVAITAASLLIAGMMACLGVSLTAFGARLSPAWDGGYLPWVCWLIAFEAIFSEGRVRHQSLLSSSRLIYRLSEVILLTVSLKLFVIFLRGQALWETFASWQRDFLYNFFAGEFGGVWFVTMLVWLVSSLFAEQIYHLVEDTDLLRPGSEPQFFTSRREMRRRLAGQILFLGAVMVVLTALTRLDLRAIWGDLPPVEVNAFNVLVYFFLALLLLSQGQFAVLRASWIWQQIPVTRPMALGWLRYSLIFLGILAVLVLILPTGYSVGLFTLAQILFSFLFSLLYFIAILLMLPIFWLFNLLSRQQSEESLIENPFQNFLQPETSNTLTPITTLPISELVRSIVFWILFLLVCGYALVQYFRQNKELLERLRRIPGLRWLTEGIQTFLEWWRGATRTVREMAAATWTRVRPPLRGANPVPWNLIRPNRLPPRERVRFFYLALIRRGQESGIPRGPSQTPAEYANTLRQALPDAEADVQELSDAFMQARYTQHPISEQRAGFVKKTWEHLRTILNPKRRA